jgi:hypothetical protein
VPGATTFGNVPDHEYAIPLALCTSTSLVLVSVPPSSNDPSTRVNPASAYERLNASVTEGVISARRDPSVRSTHAPAPTPPDVAGVDPAETTLGNAPDHEYSIFPYANVCRLFVSV